MPISFKAQNPIAMDYMMKLVRWSENKESLDMKAPVVKIDHVYCISLFYIHN